MHVERIDLTELIVDVVKREVALPFDVTNTKIRLVVCQAVRRFVAVAAHVQCDALLRRVALLDLRSATGSQRNSRQLVDRVVPNCRTEPKLFGGFFPLSLPHRDRAQVARGPYVDRSA
jgi:hypothetical protein